MPNGLSSRRHRQVIAMLGCFVLGLLAKEYLVSTKAFLASTTYDEKRASSTTNASSDSEALRVDAREFEREWSNFSRFQKEEFERLRLRHLAERAERERLFGSGAVYNGTLNPPEMTEVVQPKTFNASNDDWAAIVMSAPSRISATNRNCNVTNVTFVPPRPIGPSEDVRTRCPVRVVMAEVDAVVYDFDVCRIHAAIPDGRLWQAMGPMGHAMIDYALVEVLKVHPCRMTMAEYQQQVAARGGGLENSGTPHVDNIVGFVPVASNSVGPGQLLAAIGAGSTQLRALALTGRLFAFIPSILFPSPFRKVMKHMLYVNFITHEVGMWGRRLKANRRGDMLIHLRRDDNVPYICKRHAVVPKVDWDVVQPFPIDKRKFENNSNHSTLIFCTGRVQSLDRLKLWELSRRTSKKNFTFTTGRDVRWTFSSGTANSTFCIDTTGDSLTTTRITNAVLRGCIPLLICDDCVFPFAKLYRYRISTTFEDVVAAVTEAPLSPDFPVFAVRLSQYSLLWTRPDDVVNVVYRLFTERRDLVDRLFDGVAKAQAYFHSPLEAGSKYIDALLAEIAAGVKWQNATERGIDFGYNRRCPF